MKPNPKPPPTSQAPHPNKIRDQLVARIREDARRKPERYLREAEVPGGGE